MSNTNLQSIVKEFRQHMFAGDMNAVDQLIDQYKKSFPHDEEMKEFSNELLDLGKFGLLSFRSFSTNKEELNKQFWMREQKILEIFPFDEQLFMLTMESDDIEMKHIDMIKTPHVGDINIHQPTQSLLHRLTFLKKFDEATALIKKTNFDVRAPCDHFVLYYHTRNIKGASSLFFDPAQPFFASAIFSLDQDTLHFLLTHHVLFDDINNMKNIINKDFLINNLDTALLLNKDATGYWIEKLDQAHAIIDHQAISSTLNPTTLRHIKKI